MISYLSVKHIIIVLSYGQITNFRSDRVNDTCEKITLWPDHLTAGVNSIDFCKFTNLKEIELGRLYGLKGRSLRSLRGGRNEVTVSFRGKPLAKFSPPDNLDDFTALGAAQFFDVEGNPCEDLDTKYYLDDEMAAKGWRAYENKVVAEEMRHHRQID
jgi:hypothetical protein